MKNNLTVVNNGQSQALLKMFVAFMKNFFWHSFACSVKNDPDIMFYKFLNLGR